MTKREYVGKFADKAATLVTTPEFQALLETAREENTFLAMEKTELGVLQLSGAAIGWHKCLEFLKTAHLLPEKKPEKEHTASYRDPQEDQATLRPENKKP